MKRIGTPILLVGLLLACDRAAKRPGAEEGLETVDVGAGPDAELTTEFDERARQIAVAVSGVLPSDFPSELPLFSPSSIVDFGKLSSGRSYVDVDTSVTIREVRSSLASQVARAGWSSESLDAEAYTYSRAGRRVRIRIQDLDPGTRIRYEY